MKHLGHTYGGFVPAISERGMTDLLVHSRNLEGILHSPRIECIDGVLQVTVLGAVPARQCLPAASATTSAQVTRGVGQACLLTTSYPSKTSTVQVNSMRRALGTPLTLCSRAHVMPTETIDREATQEPSVIPHRTSRAL
jgi:hypothetical protein